MTAGEEFICGWNVIACFIPEVGKPQQWQVRKKNRGEDQRKDLEEA